MKQTFILFALLSLTFFKAKAQDDEKQTFSKFSIDQVGVAVGTNGISAEVAKQVSKNSLISLHAGYRFYNKDLTQDWGQNKVLVDPKVSTALVNVAYDWFVFADKENASNLLKSLKVKGGLQYLFDATYKFNSKLQNEIKWGPTTFTQGEVGEVNTTISTNKLQPFVAAGFDQFMLGKKYSFAADLGVLYQGKPKVDMDATNMLEQTSTQASIIENNIKGYRFFPYLTLKFNVKL